VNPLLLPPRLMLRALDDLHAIAELARLLTRTGRGIDASIDLVRALDDLSSLAETAGRLPEVEKALARTQREVVARIDGAERQLAAALDLGGRVEGQLAQVEQASANLEQAAKRLAEILKLARRLERNLPPLDGVMRSVDVLGEAAVTLATTVEPLQGAAERLGRVADRLPRPRARS